MSSMLLDPASEYQPRKRDQPLCLFPGSAGPPLTPPGPGFTFRSGVGLTGMRSVLVVIVAVAAAACGGGASQGPSSSVKPTPSALKLTSHTEPGPAPAGATELDMRGAQFVTPHVSTTVGRLVVHLVNQEHPTAKLLKAGYDFRHDMTITDANGNVLAESTFVQPGHDAVFVVDNLPAGTYPFFCSIHAHLGMVGTLTVTSG